jgi:hypothetical protein
MATKWESTCDFSVKMNGREVLSVIPDGDDVRVVLFGADEDKNIIERRIPTVIFKDWIKTTAKQFGE